MVGFVVLTSTLLHGSSSSPVMDAPDRWQDERGGGAVSEEA